MHAFVILGLVFSIPSQEISLGKRQTTNLSINQAMTRTRQPIAVLESGSVNQQLKLIELCASDLNLILFDSAVKRNRSFVCFHFLSSG